MTERMLFCAPAAYEPVIEGAQGAVVNAGGSEGAPPPAAEPGASVMQGVSCSLTRHPEGLVTADFGPLLEIHNRLPGPLEWQLELPAADGAAHMPQFMGAPV